MCCCSFHFRWLFFLKVNLFFCLKQYFVNSSLFLFFFLWFSCHFFVHFHQPSAPPIASDDQVQFSPQQHQQHQQQPQLAPNVSEQQLKEFLFTEVRVAHCSFCPILSCNFFLHLCLLIIIFCLCSSPG